MKALTLSIVIPVYNEERHIRACLDSIASQQTLPEEVIVVDNNSTDETVKIAATYPFVRIVKCKKQGIVYTRNMGFDIAKGEIIGRIDADSVLSPNWVQYLKEFYNDPQHDSHAWTGGAYFYNLRFPYFSGWAMGQIAYRMNRFIMGHYILWGSNMAITQTQWRKAKDLVCLRNDIHEDLDLAIHLDELAYEITYHEGMKVGVEMRRIVTEKDKLWDYLMIWPKTLQVHHKKLWVLGWVGGAVLFAGTPILRLINKGFITVGRLARPE